MTPPAVDEAATAALAGQLVVLPTDTVYGIGTRPDDPDATARLFAAKGRPRELSLPVLVPTLVAAREVAALDERAAGFAEHVWPGAVTIVLARSNASAGWELGRDVATIGVRIPAHPLAAALLERTGPLAVTSANRSGEATPATCGEVRAVFGEAVSVYLCALCAEDRSSSTGSPSTVIDLAHGEPVVLRPGALSAAEVEALLAGS